jgi:phosphatidate phosphatase LPIN
MVGVANAGIGANPPGSLDAHGHSHDPLRRPVSGDWSSVRIATDQKPDNSVSSLTLTHDGTTARTDDQDPAGKNATGSEDAFARAMTLSKKLWGSNIPTQVSPTGDLMLDMAGYKSSEEQALRAEVVARKILSEELEGTYDIGSLIGADDSGNIWIYSSEEAKEAADRKAGLRSLNPVAMRSTDAISDPGYHSDDGQAGDANPAHQRRDSDSAVEMSPPGTPNTDVEPDPPIRNYAKTLRLTSEQLKSLDLKPGANTMSFTVNKATCQAFMYYWKDNVPIVISDIDGTITKYDLGPR